MYQFKTFIQSGEYELFIRHAETREKAQKVADDTIRTISARLSLPYDEVAQHMRIIPVPNHHPQTARVQ